jgi:hypothetical protein
LARNRAGVCRVTADVAKLDYGIDTDGDSGFVFPYFSPPNGKPACRVNSSPAATIPRAMRQVIVDPACENGRRRKSCLIYEDLVSDFFPDKIA